MRYFVRNHTQRTILGCRNHDVLQLITVPLQPLRSLHGFVTAPISNDSLISTPQLAPIRDGNVVRTRAQGTQPLEIETFWEHRFSQVWALVEALLQLGEP
jgi:hypothetical protein